MIQNAIPKILRELKDGQKLVLTTHLTTPKNLPYLPGYKSYFETIKPSWCSVKMAGICAVLSSLARKALLKTNLPVPNISTKTWYRITWKKS